jgi:hypothetical protein
MSIQKDDTLQMLLLKAQVALPNVSNKILDIDTINMQATRPIINHDNTDVTRATKQVQKDLAMSLLFIIEAIKQKSLQYDAKDISNIEDVFRNHIQRAYQIGIAYANNVFNTKGFIEVRDLNIIKFLTDYYTQIFVNSINKILNNPEFMFNIDRSILDIQNDELEKSNLFNYIAHSISATFQALEIATVVKTLVLFDNNSVYENERRTLNAASVPTIQFYWSTSMHERVCPICMDFAKNTWAMNNWYDIPLIPHNSHPHCYCRIMIKPVMANSLESL